MSGVLASANAYRIKASHRRRRTVASGRRRQRYYDPTIGRFLSTDPVQANANTGASFNRYVYANNNPYKFTDPDGRSITCDQNSCTIHSHSVGEAVVDWGTFGVIYLRRLLQNALDGQPHRSESSGGDSSTSKPAPGEIVGTQDGKSGQQGDRVNNGPLSPEHGGTGNPESDFDHLTGGHSAPVPEGSRLPPGSKVGDNGVIYRPPNGSSGPRIDIPGNGDKPHETLHYPKPPPPPRPPERKPDPSNL
ncbi:RHS repeat-associated core domain-containing protein [Solilutibacter silvestris]|nr:RHS repeat-associated core domain-containing protein [Lysobacter silvestris]